MTDEKLAITGACYLFWAWVYLWSMCAVFWAFGNNLKDMEDPKTDFLR